MRLALLVLIVCLPQAPRSALETIPAPHLLPPSAETTTLGFPDPVGKTGPEPTPAPELAVQGTASHVGRQFGRLYLALPEHRWGHPGITVTIRGAGGSVIRTSTDAGPDLAMQRRGRIADLNAWDFAKVCGGDPWVLGTCPVTVDHGPVSLPETATQ